MLVNTPGNTKQEIGIGSIIQNFSFLSQHLFEENTYFQKVLADFYGEKEAGLIIKLLNQGFITKDEYRKIIKIQDEIFHTLFYEKVELELLNAQSNLIFTAEIFIEFLAETRILFESKLQQYKIYEILETPKISQDLQKIAEGDSFQIYLEDKSDTYYLYIDGHLYIEKELLWEERGEEVFLTQIIFSGDDKTFVYSPENKTFDTFDGDLEEILDIGEHRYLHIQGAQKTLVYNLEDGFTLTGNFIYRFFVETSDDILFFTSNYKVNQAGKKRAHTEIFSKNYGENILEFEGELLQLIEHASGDYVSYIEEESVLGEYGIQEIYHIVCARIEEETLGNYILKQVLKTPHKVQKHILPGHKESYTRMNVQLLGTSKDLYARIAYFTGDIQRDTPLYDLVSLTGGSSIRVISNIQKWDYSENGIYMEYTDIGGNSRIFDSQRQYQTYSQ